MNHVLHVVGARPNFVKAAPVLRSMCDAGLRQTLVHSGQHYDRNMSDVFFTELEIPEPDFNLEVGSGSHASQTAEIMRRFEPIVVERRARRCIGLWRRKFHRRCRVGLFQVTDSRWTR